MQPFSREVRALISACEEVHSLIAQGTHVTEDEREAIELIVTEILMKISPKPAVRG